MSGGDRILGRARAVAAVDDAVEAARAGHGGLLLVTGDAGMGKTMLAGHLLRRSAADGLVVWASCTAGLGAPAYWPWVQVLRAVVAAGPAEPLPDPLAALLDTPTRSLADEPAGAEAARFQLFDALARFLVQVSRGRPLLVVLDDLQWSDEASVLALRFLAEQVRTARLLVLGTYREAEAGPLVRELSRGARIVPLSGLDEPEIAELMATVTGGQPDPSVAHEVWRRTGGNPFFAREVTRHLGTGGAVPEAVRDVLTARLAQLGDACTDLLGYAALAGREFGVDVLVRASGRPPDQVVDLLEEAAGQRVVLKPPSPPGRYRFTHDLFRETAVGSLGSAERAGRHLRLAAALVELRDAGRPVAVAELAAHFAAAGPAAAADAVRYGSLAAAEAAARLSYEDACAHLERALVAADLADDVAAAQRLALLLSLADARYRAGRAGPARDSYRDAAALARAGDDAVALARAALGLHGLGVRAGTGDPVTTALLEEAAAVSPQHGRWRPLVLAALARDRHHHEMDGTAAALAEEAVAAARSTGDPGVLAACLLAAHDAAWQLGSAPVRRPIAEEMAVLAQRAGDAELHAQARQLCAATALELGEPSALPELADYCRLADELGHPRASWRALTRRATLASLTGHLEEAAGYLQAALELGQRIGEPDVVGAAYTQAWVLAVLGDPAAIETLRYPSAQPDPRATVYGRYADPLVRAVAVLGSGDRAGASRLLAGYPVADLPRSHDPEPLVFAAWVFAEVGPDESRQQVYELLAPLAGTGSVVGGAAAFQGPVDFYLGMLADALARPRQAAAHYRAAAAFTHRLGAASWADLLRRRLAGGNLFRREGGVWRLRYSGAEVLVQDGKGLHDLATLLAAPGREVAARELLRLDEPATGSDPVLDATARAAYRHRLTELTEEVDEAEARHDLGRAERARTERELLLRELSAAAGLGGRPRRLGDESEKARKTVTARIRYSISRIAAVHPDLGSHLHAHVHTGTRCQYLPDEPVSWQT